jgi:sugar phosphate isomerase/epimerase
MTPQTLPAVGAALRVQELQPYVDWLLDDQRDLEIQDPVWVETLDGDWRGLAAQARTLLDGHTGRRGVHGPFLGMYLFALDPKITAVVTDRLRQGVAFAHEVGGTHMVVHSPFDSFGHPMYTHSPAFGLPRDIDLVHKTLDPVVADAAAAGVTLVIETIFDLNVRPLLALVDSFDSPNVRLSVDIGHTYITHLRGGPAPDQWVREAGPRLAHVHLQDTDGLWDRHWGPGRGRINFFALFEALGTLAQSPRLILELRDKTDIARSADWLNAQGYTR